MTIQDAGQNPVSRTVTPHAGTDSPAMLQVRIWFDVTGLLRWGAQNPTGIQRVEHGLARYAAAADDIGLVAFDAGRGRFAPLSPAEAAYLDHIFAVASRPDEKPDWQRRVANSLSNARAQLAHNNAELGRRIAAAFTGDPTARTLRFKTVKAATRFVFWVSEGVRAAWLATRSAFSPKARATGSWRAADALCLVSYTISINSKFPSAAVTAGLRPAFIIHDLIPMHHKIHASERFLGRFNEFVRYALSGRQPIICLSHTVKADIEEWGRESLGIEALPPIEVCPYPNSINLPGAAVAAIERLRGRRFVLYCSTLHPRKNHHLLVSAWNRLSRTLGDDLPDLVFIGRLARSYAALADELTAASGISDRIHVLHGIEDAQLRWAYRNAYLGVFPSSAEGWGLGVSECLSFGLPVLHSDHPALMEAAQGLMPSVPAGDGEALHAALFDLLSSPAKVEALREAARTRYAAGPADGFAANVFDKLRHHAAQTVTTS